MGMESFFINIKADKAEKEIVKSILKTKAEYIKGLEYLEWEKELEEELGVESEISVIGSTFSFHPACTLMYKLCCEFAKIKANFTFNTCGEDKVFDFESKTQFVAFMYSKWEKKLDGVAEQLGIFLVHPSSAYKTLKKLKKKYYTRFLSN